MNNEKFQALYKNTKKEEIIEELYYKCKANKELVSEIERLKEENTILKQTMSNNSLLINENAFLKERIDKAIEFLNNECLYDEDLGYCDDLWCGRVQELVNILKGDDKE